MVDTVGDWAGGFADIEKVAKLVAMLCDEDLDMVNGGEYNVAACARSLVIREVLS